MIHFSRIIICRSRDVRYLKFWLSRQRRGQLEKFSVYFLMRNMLHLHKILLFFSIINKRELHYERDCVREG